MHWLVRPAQVRVKGKRGLQQVDFENFLQTGDSKCSQVKQEKTTKKKAPDLASVKDSNRAVHLQVDFIAFQGKQI